MRQPAGATAGGANASYSYRDNVVCRDYVLQDLAQLLCNTPSLVSLSLEELHELEEFDNLDTASLWDALHAAAAVPGGIASRLLSLRVSDCFWNTPELFCVLKQLTGLTQLRYAPL